MESQGHSSSWHCATIGSKTANVSNRYFICSTQGDAIRSYAFSIPFFNLLPLALVTAEEI